MADPRALFDLTGRVACVTGASGGLGQRAATGLAGVMAEACSPHRVTANTMGPVFADPERAARNAAQTCIGRNGRLEDIDGPMLFLCSDASAYVTGQVPMVDGGFTAK